MSLKTRVLNDQKGTIWPSRKGAAYNSKTGWERGTKQEARRITYLHAASASLRSIRRTRTAWLSMRVVRLAHPGDPEEGEQL